MQKRFQVFLTILAGAVFFSFSPGAFAQSSNSGSGSPQDQSQASSSQSQDPNQSGQTQQGQTQNPDNTQVSRPIPIGQTPPPPPPPDPNAGAPAASGSSQPADSSASAAKTVHPKNSKEDVDAIGNRSVGKGINFFSIEKEIALGKAMAQEVERSSKMIDDPVVTEYVNRVGQNLVRNSDAQVPFTIKVIDSDEVNAFALP